MLQHWKIGVLSVMVSAMGLARPAFATSQTVTLSVPGMTCSACPIILKKALQKVPGVEHVTATFELKEAVVTFDHSKTTLDRLREATPKADYPSPLKEHR